MLATGLLFGYVYCLVDDAIKTGALLILRRADLSPDPRAGPPGRQRRGQPRRPGHPHRTAVAHIPTSERMMRRRRAVRRRCRG